MRPVTSRFAMIFAVAILVVFAMMLSAGRLEYCGPSSGAAPHGASGCSARGPAPTLAPTQNLVFVRVESDKPDIEIRWAEE
jgi:hypothetical protein